MKDTSKAGKIYLKVARNIILDEVPNLSISQYRHILDRGDYCQLESMLGLEPYLKTMASAFSDRMATPGLYIPKHLDHIILKSNDPDVDLAETRDLCDYVRITNGDRGDIALEVIRAIHDLWVIQNEEHFFNALEANERYRFMPLELIGIDRVLWYYQRFLEPFFSVVHLTVDACYIERTYILAQETYFFQKGIRERETLSRVISQLDYNTDDIVDELTQPENAIVIARQIINQNPVLL